MTTLKGASYRLRERGTGVAPAALAPSRLRLAGGLPLQSRNRGALFAVHLPVPLDT
jgi:hypothetical protein